MVLGERRSQGETWGLANYGFVFLITVECKLEEQHGAKMQWTIRHCKTTNMFCLFKYYDVPFTENDGRDEYYEMYIVY